MIRREDVYKIGRLGKPHGVKGEISFNFDDDIFDREYADYIILDIDGILVPFFIEEYRFKNDETALMILEGIDSQEKAANLTGLDVYFPRELADRDEENVSWAQIIGFALHDINTDKVLGTIQAVDDSTINILFEIETPDGKDALIPANEALIKGIDVKQKRIDYDLPDGLMDLD